MVRVSEQSRLTAHLSYLNTVNERLDRVQQQLATGRKIDRASDDPAGATLALSYRDSIDFEAQMRRNLESGTAFMNITESTLGSATDALQRIRELTVQAANGSLGAQDRVAIGTEVNQLIEHLAQLANTNFGDAYIFSGHQTATPAYLVTGNPPTAITFQGDTGQRVRRISRQDTVAINLDGQTVFGSMFTDLIALRDNLNSGAPAATIQASLSSIDAALNRVVQGRAEIGARINRFDAATRHSNDTDTNLQGLRADIEEIDLPSTISKFQAEQQALQAALAAVGRTSNMSLVDYMR